MRERQRRPSPQSPAPTASPPTQTNRTPEQTSPAGTALPAPQPTPAETTGPAVLPAGRALDHPLSRMSILPPGSPPPYPPGTPVERQTHVWIRPTAPRWDAAARHGGDAGPGSPVRIQPTAPRMDLGAGLPGDLGGRIRAAQGGGRALEREVRRRLQAGLGADLSAVRVHTDGEADGLSRSVQATAFTTGRDIFFRHGAYNPSSPGGLHLLAHEAAHTVQQATGPVAGTPQPGGVSISDPADRFERAAEEAAAAVQRRTGRDEEGARPAGSPRTRRPPPSALTLQRDVFLGDPPTQLTAVGWWEGRTGSGARNVRGMVGDPDRKYYFKDRAEMLRYAKAETETIGYVDRADAWVRLPPHTLVVLGEMHGGTTVADVVKALGTKKFLYESYTDFPADVLRRSKRLREAHATKLREWNEKMGIAGDKSGLRHELEPYLVKIVVGLLRLKTTVDSAIAAHRKPAPAGAKGKGAGGAYSVAGAALGILQQALLIAARTAKYFPARSPALWTAHAADFKATAAELARAEPLAQTTLIGDIAAPAPAYTYDDLVQSFVDVGRQKTAADEGAMAVAYDEFEVEEPTTQSDAGLLGGGYRDVYIEFETRREYYMYQNILDAKGKGYLLAGMGDVHRLHLEDLLEENLGIEVWKLTSDSHLATNKPATFIDDQKAKYPQ